MKSNKIKICDDFKGMKSTDLIKEYLKRMDNFDEVWNSITGIFTAIFKNYFISTKKIIKLCSTSDLFSNKNEKLIKPSTAQVNSSKINNIPISKSNTLSMKNDTKKIETELYLKNNENVNEIIETHSRRKSTYIIGRITIKDKCENKKPVKINEKEKVINKRKKKKIIYI